MRFEIVPLFGNQSEGYAVKDREAKRYVAKFWGRGAQAKAQSRADRENQNASTGAANGQSGNIFFTLFAGVAMVGVLGVMSMNVLKGPIATSAAINQKARADHNLMIAGRLAARMSAQDGTDCDGDGIVEPLAPDVAAAECAEAVAHGGGCLPLTVGGSRLDPWGSPVMYCAYDHGTGTTGCPAGLRTGNAVPAGKAVIAMVSGGANRAFETTCGNDPAYVVRAAGDDVVYVFDESEAVAHGGGGLWELISGDPNTATIGKDIEVSTDATFGGAVVFEPTASLTLGGAFLLPTDATMTGCLGPDKGALRTTAANELQICDGAGDWLPVGVRSVLALDDVPDSFGTPGAFLRVNLAGDGVAFGGASFFELLDTPASYTGAGGRFVRINSGESGIEFSSASYLDLADGPASFAGAGGRFLRVNPGETGIVFSSAAFLDLNDTPNSFAGQAAASVRVNAGATALEFGPPVPQTFLDLTDTPASYAGAAGRAVLVNGTGTGLEFVSSSLFVGPQGPIGPGGAAGADGADGLNGWSPILATATDGERRVLQVVDWTGGTGAKPATGSYIGPAGLVATMAAAVDIRGAVGPAGADAPDTFTALTDTPANYAGSAEKSVRVNAGETGLEFYDPNGPIPVASCGQTWVQGTGFGTGARAVAGDGVGGFVAVGDGGASYYSTDKGVTWTAGGNVSGGADMMNVAYGGGKFVAVGYSNNAYYSTDGGASWAASGSIGGTTGVVQYLGGRWFAYGWTGFLRTSADGISWSAPTGITGELSYIAYDGSRFVAVGVDGAFWSTNGTSWTAGAGAGTQLAGLAQGNGRFVTTKGATGVPWYSTDGGATWTAGTGTSGVMSDVIYGGGRFVVVNDGAGSIYHSTDGVTWAAATGVSGWLGWGTYGGGRFVASSGSGHVVHSGNGSAWNRDDFGGAGGMRGLTYNDGRFVIVTEHAGDAFYSECETPRPAPVEAFTELSDTPDDYAGQAGRVVTVNPGETGLQFSVDQDTKTFTGLTDTPNNYAGMGFRSVRVNAGATALEFGPVMRENFIDLLDTPANYTGAAGRFVRVNPGGNALLFSSAALLELSDTPNSYAGQGGRFLRVNPGESGVAFSSAALLELSDTPNSYAGAAGHMVRVNPGGNGVLFSSAQFLDLGDTPTSYAGRANQLIGVNAGATGLEFKSPGGGEKLIHTSALTGGTVTVNNIFTAGNNYRIEFTPVLPGNSSTVYIELAQGGSWLTGVIFVPGITREKNDTTVTGVQLDGGSGVFRMNMTASQQHWIQVKLYDPKAATVTPVEITAYDRISGPPSGNVRMITGAGMTEGAYTIDHIRITTYGSGFQGGFIRIYESPRT